METSTRLGGPLSPSLSLRRASPEVLQKNEGTLVKNSYNKSLPHALWLVARAAEILAQREGKR